VGQRVHDEASTAEFGMYSFESVRWAWDALWAAIADRVDWVPRTLAHSGDVHARWDDPDCVVNQVCGWPLVTSHTGTHRVIGSFSLAIPEAEGHHYRNTVMASTDTPLVDLTPSELRAAVNSCDSLSGWISLLDATTRGQPWPGEIVLTEAHVESLAALRRGDADIACIDSWSMRLVERDQPELLAGLHRIGLGPLVPSPAVTVRTTIPETDADQLGEAFADVLADQSTTALRSALMIDGFVRTTIEEYMPVLKLMVKTA
jgi:ABC-type phosphate/phosphonate transport system substrate-binding protein